MNDAPDMARPKILRVVRPMSVVQNMAVTDAAARKNSSSKMPYLHRNLISHMLTTVTLNEKNSVELMHAMSLATYFLPSRESKSG